MSTTTAEIPRAGAELNALVTREVRRRGEFLPGMRTTTGDTILGVSGEDLVLAVESARGRSVSRCASLDIWLDTGDPATAGCLRSLLFGGTDPLVSAGVSGRLLVESSIALAGSTWTEAIARSYLTDRRRAATEIDDNWRKAAGGGAAHQASRPAVVLAPPAAWEKRAKEARSCLLQKLAETFPLGTVVAVRLSVRQKRWSPAEVIGHSVDRHASGILRVRLLKKSQKGRRLVRDVVWVDVLPGAEPAD